MSLPSGNPAALRGYTAACTIIDEACYIEHPEDVFSAILPTLTRNPEAELILVSTPAGMQGKFFEIWSNDDESWYKQSTTIEEAIEDGLKVNLDELKKLCPDPEIFAQEYQCKFSSDFGAFIDPAVLDFSDNIPNDGIYLTGIDFGRHNDATSIAILKYFNNRIYLQDIVVLRNTDYQTQYDTIKSLNDKYHFKTGFSDANGIGSALGEQIEKTINTKIKAFITTGSNKTPMYEETRSKIFEHKLILNEKLRDMLLEDFRNVNKIVSESGKVSYIAGRNDQGHADITSSIVLGVYALHENPVSFAMPQPYTRQSAFGQRNSIFSRV